MAEGERQDRMRAHVRELCSMTPPPQHEGPLIKIVTKKKRWFSGTSTEESQIYLQVIEGRILEAPSASGPFQECFSLKGARVRLPSKQMTGSDVHELHVTPAGATEGTGETLVLRGRTDAGIIEWGAHIEAHVQHHNDSRHDSVEAATGGGTKGSENAAPVVLQPPFQPPPAPQSQSSPKPGGHQRNISGGRAGIPRVGSGGQMLSLSGSPKQGGVAAAAEAAGMSRADFFKKKGRHGSRHSKLGSSHRSKRRTNDRDGIAAGAVVFGASSTHSSASSSRESTGEIGGGAGSGSRRVSSRAASRVSVVSCASTDSGVSEILSGVERTGGSRRSVQRDGPRAARAAVGRAFGSGAGTGTGTGFPLQPRLNFLRPPAVTHGLPWIKEDMFVPDTPPPPVRIVRGGSIAKTPKATGSGRKIATSTTVSVDAVAAPGAVPADAASVVEAQAQAAAKASGARASSSRRASNPFSKTNYYSENDPRAAESAVPAAAPAPVQAQAKHLKAEAEPAAPTNIQPEHDTELEETGDTNQQPADAWRPALDRPLSGAASYAERKGIATKLQTTALSDLQRAHNALIDPRNGFCSLTATASRVRSIAIKAMREAEIQANSKGNDGYHHGSDTTGVAVLPTEEKGVVVVEITRPTADEIDAAFSRAGGKFRVQVTVDASARQQRLCTFVIADGDGGGATEQHGGETDGSDGLVGWLVQCDEASGCVLAAYSNPARSNLGDDKNQEPELLVQWDTSVSHGRVAAKLASGVRVEASSLRHIVSAQDQDLHHTAQLSIFVPDSLVGKGEGAYTCKCVVPLPREGAFDADGVLTGALLLNETGETMQDMGFNEPCCVEHSREDGKIVDTWLHPNNSMALMEPVTRQHMEHDEELEAKPSLLLSDNALMEFLPDGSQEQWNEDGSHVLLAIDGSRVDTAADGTVTKTTAPSIVGTVEEGGHGDGFYYQTFDALGFISAARGPATSVTTIELDGTEIHRSRTGSTKQKHADGSEQYASADGTMLRTNKDGSTLAISADGTKTSRETDGRSVVQYPDGTRVQTEPDGTELRVDAEGTKTQMNTDGTSVVQYPDGRAKHTLADGTMIEIAADGTKTQHNVDGSSIITTADGKRKDIGPDGVVISTLT